MGQWALDPRQYEMTSRSALRYPGDIPSSSMYIVEALLVGVCEYGRLCEHSCSSCMQLHIRLHIAAAQLHPAHCILQQQELTTEQGKSSSR